ncbi:hypothetical protein [Bordetella genomosp. 10]|uniref:hypothetical protein n=1 Tax=Bordetella genomosp. 10 TaxID=1416804 RepID=UPI0011780645|nr:hypothetical protein [Bordetella genomosp. 10]
MTMSPGSTASLPAETPANECPLSDDDLQLLRRYRRGSPFQAVFGTYLFLAFLGSGVAMLVIAFDPGSYRKAGLLLPLMAAVLLGLAIFTGMRLARMPRSWLRVNRALAGGIPKQLVSGTLQEIAPGARPGIRYVLDTKQVDVALPYWNEIMTDTNLGMRAQSAHAVTGGKVTLHLLPLLPGHQPLLLRAEYHDSQPVRVATAPLSEQDHETFRKSASFVRVFVWSLAGIFVIVGLAMPPLLLVAAILVLIGFIPAPNSRAMKQATHKRTVSGVVDEALTFRLLQGAAGTRGSSVSMATKYSYRVGGTLYQVSDGDIQAEPGQRVTLELLDGGASGLTPLSFRIDAPH